MFVVDYATEAACRGAVYTDKDCRIDDVEVDDLAEQSLLLG